MIATASESLLGVGLSDVGMCLSLRNLLAYFEVIIIIIFCYKYKALISRLGFFRNGFFLIWINKIWKFPVQNTLIFLIKS